MVARPVEPDASVRQSARPLVARLRQVTTSARSLLRSVARPWSGGETRLGRLVGLTVMALALGFSATTVDFLVRARQEALERAQIATQNTAVLIERQAGSLAETVGLLLQAAGAQDRVGEPLVPGSAGSAASALLSGMAYVRGVAVLDGRTGTPLRLVQGAGLKPVGDAARRRIDLELVMEHQDEPDAATLHVSRPQSVVRPDGATGWLLGMSRRLDAARIAVAYVDTRVFQDAVAGVDMGQDGGLVLVRADGVLLARQPDRAPSPIGHSLFGSRMFAMLGQGAPVGSYMAPGVLDGTERLVSYRAVPGTPLIVAAGRGRDAVLDAWWNQARRDLFLAGTGLLALVVGALAILREAAKRERVVAELGRSEVFLRSMLEGSGDAIMVLDTRGRVLLTNAAAEAALEAGGTPGQGTAEQGTIGQATVGQELAALFPPERRATLRGALATALREGTARLTSATGAAGRPPRYWDIGITALADATGQPERLVTISRDVTGQVEAEGELRDAKAAAERARQATADFLASMSHELRTPLNGLLGAAELLGESAASPRERDLVRVQQAAGRQLVGLIGNILDWSKIEEGRLTLSREAVDLRLLVETCLALVEPMATAKGLSIAHTLELDAPAIWGDRLRLQQVALNYLSNAIKFTPARLEGAPPATVRFALHYGAGKLRVAVEDAGPGIPRSRQHLLFQKFSQAGTASQEGGSGLGLAISRRIAEAMGGQVGVESREGAGALFWFEADLPAADLPEAPARREAPARPAGPGAAPPRLVLAEDVASSRAVLTALLESLGCTVTAVADGAEAVEAVRRSRPDLVLMDMQMPVLSGLDATRAIRALPGGTMPIVALTASAFPEQVRACLDAGMDGHLAKPIDRAALAGVLRRWAGWSFDPPRPAETVAVPAAVLNSAALDELRQHLGDARVVDLAGYFEREVARALGELDRGAELGRVAHQLVAASGALGLDALCSASRAAMEDRVSVRVLREEVGRARAALTAAIAPLRSAETMVA